MAPRETNGNGYGKISTANIAIILTAAALVFTVFAGFFSYTSSAIDSRINALSARQEQLSQNIREQEGVTSRNATEIEYMKKAIDELTYGKRRR